MVRRQDARGSTLLDFDKRERKPPHTEVDRGRFRGALVFAAVGDALGWPTEFLKPGASAKPAFDLPLRNYVSWNKTVGGKWWGYTDTIAAGDYSDDTQLTLSVARSIADSGIFEPRTFAYLELPLWLQYERGGGRSIKAAAHSLVSRRVEWSQNFYHNDVVDYRTAGANGAAMRNLPISLVAVADVDTLIRASFQNAIITHGHPRAILGAVVIGLATHFALNSPESVRPSDLVEFVCSQIKRVRSVASASPEIREWIARWDSTITSRETGFETTFDSIASEAINLVSAIPEYLTRPIDDFYRFSGALRPETKGSGVATVACGIFMFLKFQDRPEEGLLEAVNELGSDTDTIAGFMGGLLGANQGMKVIPGRLLGALQDRTFIVSTADRLHTIATGRSAGSYTAEFRFGKEAAYLKILAWEIGLHEMFWDAISIGGKIVHPALGRGTITDKLIREMSRPAYVAKIMKVSFDSGQTCIFHSRVQDSQRITESLARDVVHELELGSSIPGTQAHR